MLFRSKEHLEIMRAELSVNGKLERVHARRPDVKWRLTLSDDCDTRARPVLGVVLLYQHSSLVPIGHIQDIYRAVFARK